MLPQQHVREAYRFESSVVALYKTREEHITQCRWCYFDPTLSLSKGPALLERFGFRAASDKHHSLSLRGEKHLISAEQPVMLHCDVNSDDTHGFVDMTDFQM